MKQMCRKLWYLSSEASTFSFFDENFPVEIKQKIITALSIVSEDEFILQYSLISNYNTFMLNKGFEDLISSESIKLYFYRFKRNTDFLSVDPSTWQNYDSYKKAEATVKNIHVVNYVANEKLKKNRRE